MKMLSKEKTQPIPNTKRYNKGMSDGDKSATNVNRN